MNDDVTATEPPAGTPIYPTQRPRRKWRTVYLRDTDLFAGYMPVSHLLDEQTLVDDATGRIMLYPVANETAEPSFVRIELIELGPVEEMIESA